MAHKLKRNFSWPSSPSLSLKLSLLLSKGSLSCCVTRRMPWLGSWHVGRR